MPKILVLEKNYWIRIIVSCAKKEIKVYSKNFKKLRNCKILLPALYLIMWLMKSQFDFENMTACFWGIKIHFGKKWFLNIDSSIVIALQTGLKQIIKLQYPNLSNRYLRKAKNRNKCKVISLFAELLFSIFS